MNGAQVMQVGNALVVATVITSLRSSRFPAFRNQALVISTATLSVTAGHAYNLLRPERPEVAGLIVVLAIVCLIVSITGLSARERTRFVRTLEKEVESRTRELRHSRQRLQEMQEDLLRAERLGAGEQLAASIAHALNNPLTALVGYLQMAAEAPEACGPWLQRSLAVTVRIRGLVDRTLSIFQQGTLELENATVAALFQPAINSVTPEAEALGIKFVRQIPPDLSIPADSALFSEALTILVRNALEALSGPGEIFCSAERLLPTDAVRIEVTDTGPGIPKELRTRVLEPFFTTKPDGSGLGLPIAAGIVRGHGGRLVIDSLPGGGTRIRIELPGGAARVEPAPHNFSFS